MIAPRVRERSRHTIAAVVAAAVFTIGSCAVFATGAGAAPRADTPPTVHTVTAISAYSATGTPDPGTWFASDPNTGVGTQAAIVGSPSDPLYIDGSLRLATSGADDVATVATNPATDPTLGSLKTITYEAERASASTADDTGAVASLMLGLSCDGTTPSGTLTFSPEAQGGDQTVTPGQFQSWDAYKDGAALWSASWYLPIDPGSGLLPKQSLTGDDNPDAYFAPGATQPLSDFVTSCPDGTITQYSLSQGPNEAGLTSYVDDLRINDDLWDFGVTATPTVSVDFPSTLTAGAPPVAFTGTLTDPANGPQVPNGRIDFILIPSSNMGSLAPDDVTLKYELPGADTFTPVTLSAGPSGSLTGELGPHTGYPEPLEPGQTLSLDLQIQLGPNVKGGVLQSIVELQSVNPDTGDIVRSFAPAGAAGGQTAVLGPALCPAFPGSSAVVRLAYLRMLNRCPDQQGLVFWTGFLDSGHSQTEFALDLASSPERFTNLINRSYEAVFNRAPDPGGLSFWQQYFQSGGRFDTFIGMLAASTETANAHPGAQALVEAMYHIVLNRAGDPDGIAYWTQKVQSGTSAGSLAAQLAYSSEFATDVVGSTPTQLATFGPGIYQEILNRPPDSNGLVFWATYFHNSGVTYYLEGLVGGSAEFYNQAQTFPDS